MKHGKYKKYNLEKTKHAQQNKCYWVAFWKAHFYSLTNAHGWAAGLIGEQLTIGLFGDSPCHHLFFVCFFLTSLEEKETTVSKLKE